MRIALLLILAACGSPPSAAPAARFQTVAFESSTLGRTTKYQFLAPTNASPPWPVAYLVHGFVGDYREIPSLLDAAEIASLGIAVVTPDVGNTWCVDWPQHPMQTFLANDLLADVEARFPVRRARDGRAIGGISMGASCGVLMAAHHPQLFGTVVYHSGENWYDRVGNDLEAGTDRSRPNRKYYDAKVVDIPGYATQRERTPKGLPFGDVAQARAFDPWARLETLSPLPVFYIDAGDADEDLHYAHKLRDILGERGAEHVFHQPPGAHTRDYFVQRLPVSLRFLRRRFYP